MSASQRLLLVAIAVVIAVGAIVVIGSGGDDDEKASSTSATETTTETGPATADQETAKPAKPAGPPVERIEVRGGQPAGGPKRIEVKKGDPVRIVVSSDSPQEVHLHGYDIEREAAPGKPGRFAFKANAEGIFEMELHHGTQAKLASLVVSPS